MIELPDVEGVLENGSLVIPGEAVYDVYRPAETLQYVSVSGRTLVLFGFTGAFGSLLLDLSSGHVMEKLQNDPDVSLVNTSLEAFKRCLGEFHAKFPLSDIDDEDEAEERDNKVAREIEKDVLRIDPQAYNENSFWYEVRWSVAIGDFRG